MPCICAIAGAIPPDYVDASYSSKTEKKASVDAEGNFDPKPVETTKYRVLSVCLTLLFTSKWTERLQCFNICYVVFCSTIIPEKLDGFMNRYAEYTHDKWAFEKVWFQLDCLIFYNVVFLLVFRNFIKDFHYYYLIFSRSKITGHSARCWMKMPRPIPCSDLTKHSLKR